MKITKETVKKIIMEELQREGLFDFFKSKEPKLSPLNKELKAFFDFDTKAKRIFDMVKDDPDVAQYLTKGDYENACKMMLRVQGLSNDDYKYLRDGYTKIWKSFR